MFVFKDGKEIDMFVLGRQSCYLFGRDRTVVDIPTEHPSCSKQHAVIQFRQVTRRNEFGDVQRFVKPFLIDLDSANGCCVNGEDVPPSRYYELRSGDTCQFGASAREYVLLDESAAT
ncbi:Similar to S.cerevisiae protein PML1 (Subunit of the RES complex) [Malassezia sympodialis ATCC 42132]|uniref:Similar to S.cerevisiae protein PML1 (Subunit of the RES complex) n=1 Tax=Malassezia sympodialis (strain ATCC 42132) TaxID=1230383 RepID=A0A1M8ACM6_MALS4|nr:Similar to S.cerevisiae protein PML1 (Subunit of the RES complex) [Malassezia sympodialis ATCC 42132]